MQTKMKITEQEKRWLRTMGGRDESDMHSDDKGKFTFLGTIKVYVPIDVETMFFRGKDRRSILKQSEEERAKKRHDYYQKWYAKNREKRLAQLSIYNNLTEVRTRNKKWYEEHRIELAEKAKAKRIADGWTPRILLSSFKRCKQCHIENVPLIKTNKYWICRKCNNEKARKFYKSENGKASIKRCVAKSIKKNPEKQNCRIKLNMAVKRGEILKPTICEICHLLPLTRIEAHHKDYTKPYEVFWCCSGCHADLHRLSTVKSFDLFN